MSTEPKKVGTVESFSRSLAELTVNSKPHINFLTMVAKENSYQAEAIVNTIQNHLTKSSCILKLPILYLIDSIIKNVGKEYISLFSSILVNNFANIYAEVDKSTQQLMGVLRQTWNGIISSADLSKLDLQVHTLDQQWQLPSDALKNTTIKILLNPNFLPQRVPSQNSILKDSPKVAQELSDEDDDPEVLREQLLLQKKQRELEKRKLQLENCISENNNESSSELTEGSCEAPIVIDLEPSENQVDSTTVDKTPNEPIIDTDTSDLQCSTSTVSVTHDKSVPDKHLSGELLELLTDLIAKQNVKLQSNDEHQVSRRNKDKEYCDESFSTSERYSGKYAGRRSYRNSYKYRHSKNKSADRSHDHKYSYRRDGRNKDRGNEDSIQSKRQESQVLQGKKSSLDSSLSTSGHLSAAHASAAHSSAAHSPKENNLLLQTSCSALSSYNGEKHGPLKSSDPNPALSGSIPQAKAPVDLHLNNISDHRRNFNHNLREHKKPLLPTPSPSALILEPNKPMFSALSQNILLVHSIQNETNSFVHSTEQFSCTSSKVKEVVEIQLQKEIDYNHGLGCPMNNISNKQSPSPIPLWYPPSPVNVEYLQRQSPKNTCLEGPPLLLPPANNYILGKIAQDTVKTILVDNVTKEVHFYGEIAVIDAGEKTPREITFKPGEASVCINSVVVTCTFDQSEKKVFLGGKLFRVHFGAPTRELYINDEPFQCQFNFPPEQVQLSSGEMLTVQMFAEATPLVHIGASCRDLVAGDVTLTIDTIQSLRILLHAKPQRFDIDGIPHILKFADALQTIFINDYLVNLKFGGPPILIIVNGVRHQIQLSNLPVGIIPGAVNITSMAQTDNRPYTIPNGLSCNPVMPSGNAPKFSYSREGEKRKHNLLNRWNKRRKNSSQASTTVHNVHGNSKNSDLPVHSDSVARDSPAYYPNTNIQTLFQSLCEVGLLVPNGQLSGIEKVQSSDIELHVVDFKDLSSLKKKQPGMVEILYSGVQCNSCGARFPPELTDVYRQHLDWHFHQNHKTRYTAKCHSRPWYCEKKVWIQSEDYKDTMDIDEESLPQECDVSPRKNPSVPSHGFPPRTVCEMCGEIFDDFFNEDQDEWHLKNCILFEEKLFHPACLNDRQASAIMMDTQPIMKEKNTILHENEICEDSVDNHTDCAHDLPTEIKGNAPNEQSNTSENPGIPSVISVGDTSSEKEIVHAVLDINNAGSPMLSREEKPSQGDTKVAFLSLRKPSDDGKNTIEINQIETNTVELSINCVKAAASHSTAIPTEIYVSSPTCDNSTNVLEVSIPNVSEIKLLPSLESGSEDERSLKPKLVGRKLSHLPPTIKGSETSNMCSLS